MCLLSLQDESMHSGADVEALSAALNRDIGGDPAALARPPESDTGQALVVIFVENSSFS